ncbi:MAG: prepilin-type N-terminal cleavage/methylation domain-containing protein [Planctomycetaceae bacterium]|nr:prepilin-type N-terminal cleavage/methylation domain-containing protein [Planctomycetaceae bacterium]
MNNRDKKAFTLVELLVVISIIAVLLSVLMPALTKAREIARSAVCKSNEKQLALASTTWSTNNDDWAPPVTWNRSDPFAPPFEKYSNPGSLQRYLGGASQAKSGTVLTCPSAVFSTFSGTVHEEDILAKVPQNKRNTYAINGWMAAAFRGAPYKNNFVSPGSLPTPGRSGVEWEGPPGDRTYNGGGEWGIYNYLHGSTKFCNVRRPGETIFFIDHEFGAIYPGVFDPLAKSKSNPVTLFATRWHDKKPGKLYGYANVSWVDGHSSREPSDLSQLSPAGTIPRWCHYFWNH